MSRLVIYDATSAKALATHRDAASIAAALAAIHVRFERWQATQKLSADADDAAILAAYAPEVERLKKAHGFASADVIAVGPEHPQRVELRKKFLDEHTHSEFEVRFFVDGSGLFYLHVGKRVYAILCAKGDLLSVPAGVTHWFDMGGRPSLRCIRLFTTPEGWVASYTGDKIAQRFPTYEDFIAAA